MTNATIQNLFSFPMLPESRDYVTGSTLYRSNHWDRVSFRGELIGLYNHAAQVDSSWGNVAHSIWHEAQRFDTLTDAHAENFSRTTMAPVEGAPLPALVFDQDTQAALVQAELLGATADQRAKLRSIVTARINAERALTESCTQLDRMRQQLASTQQALDTANEDILDGHDPRTMQLFANTGAVADKQGLCSVYDQIARDSLIPTRPELADAGFVGETASRDWDVSVSVSINVMTTVTVTATSEEDADSQVAQMSHRDIWEYVDPSNASHYDISDFETGDVEPVDN